MKSRAWVKRLCALLWPLAATAALGASLTPANPPWVCDATGWDPANGRMPAELVGYFDSLGADNFDSRAACAQWAGL